MFEKPFGRILARALKRKLARSAAQVARASRTLVIACLLGALPTGASVAQWDLKSPLSIYKSFRQAAADTAEWRLDNAASSLTYLSLKMSGANSIYEKNRFGELSGGLDEAGARIEVNLASIDTLVLIRDERVLKHVFDAAQFPRARIFSEAVAVPEVGATDERDIDATLEMRGTAVKVKGRVNVTRPQANTLVVQTTQPVLIDARKWAMGDGFEALREIVKLAHISTTIPVSFRFVFRLDESK